MRSSQLGTQCSVEVFFGSNDRKIYAIREDNGEYVWSLRLQPYVGLRFLRASRVFAYQKACESLMDLFLAATFGHRGCYKRRVCAMVKFETTNSLDSNYKPVKSKCQVSDLIWTVLESSSVWDQKQQFFFGSVLIRDALWNHRHGTLTL